MVHKRSDERRERSNNGLCRNVPVVFFVGGRVTGRVRNFDDSQGAFPGRVICFNDTKMVRTLFECRQVIIDSYLDQPVSISSIITDIRETDIRFPLIAHVIQNQPAWTTGSALYSANQFEGACIAWKKAS